MKECSQCKNNLENESFPEDKRKKDKVGNKCKKCIKENVRQWHKNNRKHRIENGLCLICNKKKILKWQYCVEHWLKEIATKHLGSVKHYKFLKELAEKQNFLCPYTKIKLIPGDNMSLDHVIPISKDPSLKHDPNNVQWTTWTVNKMKHNLSHTNFLKMCQKVSDKF